MTAIAQNKASKKEIGISRKDIMYRKCSWDFLQLLENLQRDTILSFFFIKKYTQNRIHSNLKAKSSSSWGFLEINYTWKNILREDFFKCSITFLLIATSLSIRVFSIAVTKWLNVWTNILTGSGTKLQCRPLYFAVFSVLKKFSLTNCADRFFLALLGVLWYFIQTVVCPVLKDKRSQWSTFRQWMLGENQ